MMDYTKPIEIAPRIWWVGYVIPDDPFQCHVYLIEDGDSSVLIDPGSMITFPVVLEKIVQVVPLRNIKYIIMHHQDPDIVSCYNTLESIMPKSERYIVTHWRAEMLLKHYQWKTPFYLVDEHEWKLHTNTRELEFVFTPYAHFPGAFCTYDKKSGVLFSSDLFGALTDTFSLYADEKSYIEGAKLFHKHYIPSKEILNHAILQVEKKDPSLIAPQHGSIIKKEFIPKLLTSLKDLDCGLYLLDEYNDDIFLLNKVDEILKHFFITALYNTDVKKVLIDLFSYLQKELAIERMTICLKDNINFDINTKGLAETKECFKADFHKIIEIDNEKIADMYIFFTRKLTTRELTFLELLLKKLKTPLGVALKRDLILKKVENIAQKDNLTGAYNRYYLERYFERLTKNAKKYHFPFSIIMIDIDHFKKFNDTYGHLVGDCVLKELTNFLEKHIREDDKFIRWGGEEFIIIMPYTKKEHACKRIDTLRQMISEYNFCKEMELHVTFSAGVEEYKEHSLDELIASADKKLYIAKHEGRNKVVC